MFLGLALLAATSLPAAAQFSVQPVIVELTPGPAGADAVLTVRNESTDAMQLRVYVSDFDQPEAGGHVFMDAGTHERSCAARLELSADNLLLEPRSTGEVRLRMAAGGSTCWSLVFVQSVARSGSGIRIAQRIGVKVYGVPAAATLGGEISEVRIESEAGGREVEIAFENTGEAPVRPEGEVEIRSESGEVLGVVPVAAFSVLPGRVARVRVPVQLDLPPGRYIVVPILDFGGEYLAGGQALLRIGGP